MAPRKIYYAHKSRGPHLTVSVVIVQDNGTFSTSVPELYWVGLYRDALRHQLFVTVVESSHHGSRSGTGRVTDSGQKAERGTRNMEA
jgi:hypothetical protein